MNNLAKALVIAQAQMTGAKKDSKNPFFKSSYADLASVMEAIRPALSANGLGFVQLCHDAPDCAKIETVIIHESGETMSCGTISVPVSKNDAQAYGSAITYAKRYSLQAAFGVPSVDDDGYSAASQPPKSVSRDTFDKMTDEEKKFLNEIAREARFLANNEGWASSVRYITKNNLDADERVALNALFDSKERAAMKEAIKPVKEKENAE